MRAQIARLVAEEAGQDLIEYAFLARFIAIAVMAVLRTVGTAMNTQYANIATQVGAS